MNVPPENQLTNCGGIVYKQDYFMNEINNLAAMFEEEPLGNTKEMSGEYYNQKGQNGATRSWKLGQPLVNIKPTLI